MAEAKYIVLTPTPSSLIESLRAIGYSMETAVADIIDNSITAKATQIQIRCSWNLGNPWLAIADNGFGMSYADLVHAMRLGSMSPTESRSLDDLGRFGLGMKTASFSQCRHLTVLSQESGDICGCEWDLNKIAREYKDQWILGVISKDTIRKRKILDSLTLEYLTDIESGTIVLWEDIDIIEEQATASLREKYFNALVDEVRKHIELVFHRFMAPESGRKKIKISINGDELTAFNPFNNRCTATRELEEQQFVIDGEKIIVQPYVLPHHNKVSREEYDRYAGEGGYLHNQGFYVYRNKRLIIKGTWFRLIKKEELNKLIRTRIDIPNTLDHLWKIDVKKSSAFPSGSIKSELRKVIGKIEGAGKAVYRQRGNKLASSVTCPVWIRTAKKAGIVYEIDRVHPLIQQLLNHSGEEQKELLRNVISLIESSFPVDLFYNDIASTPEQVKKPKMEKKDIEKLLDIFITFWTESGISEDEIEAKLLSTDPFASNEDITRELLQAKGLEA